MVVDEALMKEGHTEPKTYPLHHSVANYSQASIWTINLHVEVWVMIGTRMGLNQQ